MTTSEKIDILYKKIINRVSYTKPEKWKSFEESFLSTDAVLTSDIWIESNSIPSTNPLINSTNGQISGPIVKFDKTPLSFILNSYAFCLDSINNVICPELGFDDSYAYTIWIKDDRGQYTIPLVNDGTWFFDPSTGVLVFLNNAFPFRVSSTDVPAITCYIYNGLTADDSGNSIIGDQGARGPQGPQGYMGADSTGMRYRGQWASNSIYYFNDVVIYGSSSYVSVSTNSASMPPSIHWKLLSDGSGAGAYQEFSNTFWVSSSFTGGSPYFSSWESVITHIESLPISTHSNIIFYPGEYTVTPSSRVISNRSVTMEFYPGSSVQYPSDNILFENCILNIIGSSKFNTTMYINGSSNARIKNAIIENGIQSFNTSALHPPVVQLEDCTINGLSIFDSINFSCISSKIYRMNISRDSNFHIKDSQIGSPDMNYPAIRIYAPLLIGPYNCTVEYKQRLICNSIICVNSNSNIIYDFDPVEYNIGSLCIKGCEFINITNAINTRPIMPRNTYHAAITPGYEKSILLLGKNVFPKNIEITGGMENGIIAHGNLEYLIFSPVSYSEKYPWNV